MSAHEQEDIDEDVHDHEDDGGKQPEEDQCPLSDNASTPETRTIVFYDNWNTTSPMKMFNCERCNHSWAYDSSNEPGTCIKCESDFRNDDSSGVNTSIITSPSTEYHRIQESNMSCDPPSVYSVISKHYFVSTHAIRGCADNSRNEFFNLNIKFPGDHQDPEPGFLKLAKIAHSFNNLSKMSSYIVNGMILGDKSWFFPVKFFFGENPASIFKYRYRSDHAILVAVKIFPKGKPAALWLTDDGSVVCDGGKQPLSIVSFFADLKKNRSQYSTTQLFSAEEYNEMCDGLIQYEPMSDPKKYEPKDPRDIKIEHLEKDLDKLQKDVESLMKKVVGNENSIKKKQDKLQEDFGKCDAKILTVENKLLSKISTLEQKVKNIPKENKMLQEKPVATKGKRNVTATAVESGASPEKKKLPGPTYHLSSIPMASLEPAPMDLLKLNQTYPVQQLPPTQQQQYLLPQQQQYQPSQQQQSFQPPQQQFPPPQQQQSYPPLQQQLIQPSQQSYPPPQLQQSFPPQQQQQSYPTQQQQQHPSLQQQPPLQQQQQQHQQSQSFAPMLQNYPPDQQCPSSGYAPAQQYQPTQQQYPVGSQQQQYAPAQNQFPQYSNNNQKY